ncbi:hypothetical protein FRX31_006223 [Thalictrum thalictroides]|uniref:NAC domain-containing protein n=1 Tax=Thalictrum thalictroides TaxID=46969 RepID=A0A7J6X6I7_THATH|nr:hypothetical protein FRX31_006223 [Thalictrum thalictroides]
MIDHGYVNPWIIERDVYAEHPIILMKGIVSFYDNLYVLDINNISLFLRSLLINYPLNLSLIHPCPSLFLIDLDLPLKYFFSNSSTRTRRTSRDMKNQGLWKRKGSISSIWKDNVTIGFKVNLDFKEFNQSHQKSIYHMEEFYLANDNFKDTFTFNKVIHDAIVNDQQQDQELNNPADVVHDGVDDGVREDNVVLDDGVGEDNDKLQDQQEVNANNGGEGEDYPVVNEYNCTYLLHSTNLEDFARKHQFDLLN